MIFSSQKKVAKKQYKIAENLEKFDAEFIEWQYEEAKLALAYQCDSYLLIKEQAQKYLTITMPLSLAVAGFLIKNLEVASLVSNLRGSLLIPYLLLFSVMMTIYSVARILYCLYKCLSVKDVPTINVSPQEYCCDKNFSRYKLKQFKALAIKELHKNEERIVLINTKMGNYFNTVQVFSVILIFSPFLILILASAS